MQLSQFALLFSLSLINLGLTNSFPVSLVQFAFVVKVILYIFLCGAHYVCLHSPISCLSKVTYTQRLKSGIVVNVSLPTWMAYFV